MPEQKANINKFVSNSGLVMIYPNYIEYRLLNGHHSPTLADLKNELQFILQSLNGKKLPLLGDQRNLKQIDLQLVNFMRSNSTLFTNRVAILLNPGISKFLFHSSLLFQKTEYPIKGFTNKNKALEWLLNKY